jgi:hypothetical protein
VRLGTRLARSSKYRSSGLVPKLGYGASRLGRKTGRIERLAGISSSANKDFVLGFVAGAIDASAGGG